MTLTQGENFSQRDHAANPAQRENMPQAPPKEPRKRLWLLVRVLLSFGLLGMLFASIDLKKIADLFVGLRWEFFALVIVVLVFERILNAWKWQILLRSVGSRLGLWPLFRIVMSSSCFGLFLPSALGMDVLRMVAVSRCSDRPIRVVAATAVDRGLSVFVNLLLAAITSLFAAGVYIPWPVALIFPALFAVFVLSGFLLIIPQLSRLVYPLLLKVVGEAFAGKLRSFYISLLEFRHHGKVLAANILVFVLIIVVRVTIVSLEAMTLNIEVSFFLLFLVLPLTWVALMLPISIGGLGLQEGAYFVFFSYIGVSGAAAVSISLLEHVVIRIANLPGLFFYLRGGLVGGKVENLKDSDNNNQILNQ